MPINRSISKTRNKTKKMSPLVREKNEPIHLTKNGEGDMVIMTIDHDERLKARSDLFQKLAVAQAQSAAGTKGITHVRMMTSLRRHFRL